MKSVVHDIMWSSALLVELVASFTNWPNALLYLKITVSRNDPAYLQIRSFDRAHVSQKARDHAHSRTMIRNRVHRISLTPPLHAQAWAQMQTRLSSRLQPHLVGALYRHAVEVSACT